MDNRNMAFWFLYKYCGELLKSLEEVNFDNRLERVCFDFMFGGCKNRQDYEFLVEYYRIFQHLEKDNWIIVELLK